jgi:1,2-diacylglycerol 3-beta-galactosyltransferase
VKSMKLPYPHHVEGFTTLVPLYMRLADYFIGKPGPGSISEALVSGLPVIVESNRWTMVQERYNTEWISEHQFGVVLHSFAEIATGILPMLDAERLAGYRERVRAIGNRAVLEIPEMLAEILAAHSGWNAAAPWLDVRHLPPSGAAA